MDLSIVAEADMTPSVDERIRAGLCACFPADAAVFSATRAWHGSGPEFSVLLQEADRLIAHAGIVRRAIDVGGRPLLAAGVQNVFVLPAYRGKNLADLVLHSAMAEARRRGCDCGLLFCVPALEPVYGRCRWRALGERQVVRVEDGRLLPLPGQNIAMFYPLLLAAFPDGPIHLQGNDW
ncbi:MAG: GNAT family N-acetyltransferase [Thermoguttaceae bacterium]|jgi:GNAT superfamily N-acetyltransferase